MSQSRLSRLRRGSEPSGPLVVAPGTGGRAELAALGRLYRAVGWREPATVRLRDRFLLAWRDRLLVGALMYWEEDADDEYEPLDESVPYRGASRFHIQEVAVSPNAQRAGVGRALMHATAQTAVSDNVGWLWTWPQETSADETAARIAFYSACGLTELRRLGERRIEMVGTATAVLLATATVG